MTEQQSYYLLGEVSRILDCMPHRIVYLLTTSQVPEPRLRVGNRRLFTSEDVGRIAVKLGIDLRQPAGELR